MHVLFVHQNFPAQFGHIATHLIRRHGYRCTFVSEVAPGQVAGIERIQYKTRGGATRQTHYCSRTFENAVWHTHAVFEALKQRPEIQPDLIVGHSGFGSTLFLGELYDCPIINYFEYFYRSRNSDMDFRPDFPTNELTRLRARSRNAMLLLDLENCAAAYSPTRWQQQRLPHEFAHKVRVLFDGIDTEVWTPNANAGGPRQVGTLQLEPGQKLVTYVSRGFESMRGFDIFMKVAKRLCDERRDVVFVVVGEDRICYGGDQNVTGQASFKQWVLDQDAYDLSRIHFVGRVPPRQLAALLSLSDLHIYLTVPFVLSWSLMNSLACGCTVLASSTAPVREMIQHEQNGLLADFFDIDEFVRLAHQVLNDPEGHRPLGQAGCEMIREHYSMEVCLPKMLELYEATVSEFHSSA